MPGDTISQLTSQINDLGQAMIEIVDVQRTMLQEDRQVPDNSLLERLDGLQGRLQAIQQETSSITTQDDQPERPRFGEIDVERINVVEPDGTLRMTLSCGARAPDPVVDDFTFKREGGNQAGIIFYNQEGDECGGLVFEGGSGEDGFEAGAALLFDQFKQDQTVGIQYNDTDGRRMAGLKVWDRSDIGFRELAERFNRVWQLPEGPERTRGIEEMESQGLLGAQRVFVGKDVDGTSMLSLHDGKGNVRVSLRVEAAGAPRLEFLDEEGTVMFVLPDA